MLYNESRTTHTDPLSSPARGRLITFEGIDGSGKSTQIDHLSRSLTASGHQIMVLREPGGTRIGESIRSILLDRSNTDMCMEAELLLFAAARAQIVQEVIVPELEAGRWIICDRFADSTTAYQGYGRQLDLAVIASLNQLAVGSCKPDMTIWLDLPVETALERLAQRERKQDRMDQENIAFMERTREGYRQLADAEPDRIVRMDATQSEKELAEMIYRTVREGLST